MEEIETMKAGKTEMASSVRLVDEDAGALKAIADSGVEVSMLVPHRDFEVAWELLGKIMDKEPNFVRRTWSDDGRTEEELRLLVGLFWTVSRALPMSSSNFIDWLDRTWGSDALADYAVYRVRQMDDNSLRDRVLYDRDLDALGFERIEDPVRGSRRKAA